MYICLCADDDSKNLLIIVGSRCFPRSHPTAKTAFVCVLSLMFILTFFFVFIVLPRRKYLIYIIILSVYVGMHRNQVTSVNTYLRDLLFYYVVFLS